MELLTDIKTIPVKNSKLKEIDFDHIAFGKHFSDHMLVADFHFGEWKEPAIVPFGNLSLSPSTLALHYGQTVFEGMKAFRMADGRVNIFRLDKHFERFNRSLRRICMAEVPYEIFEEGMKQLIALDKNWVPGVEQGALYIRPFSFASEARLGVSPANEYRFIIFTGPVGQLFAKPIKVKIETSYIRAAKGGTGFAKCGGNYAASLYPTKLAQDEGYENVIWTDASEHKFLEESGVMNLMFVFNGKLVTPPASETILDGVTRDSLLTLAKDMDIEVEERPVSVDEIITSFENKTITEAFGVGTAAVVAPIATIGIGGTDYQLPTYNDQNIMFRLKRRLDVIRSGVVDDEYGWNTVIG
jgi:branched-chain amino acid aminotransferase